VDHLTVNFTVALKHLAPDASKASADLPDAELSDVTTERLRRLIDGLAKLAPQVQYPATPELRITAPDGRFLVQVRDGKIKFTSWSLRTGGSELTPAQIFAAITGEELDDRPVRAAAEERKGLPRGAKVALLALVILGSNAVTAWFAMRPPARLPVELLPQYRLIDEDQGQRLLANMAGDYATGSAESDRVMTIKKDGAVRWWKIGENRSVVEEETFVTKPVQVQPSGTSGLLANNAIIELKDPITVMFFGEAYRRKVQ
jgi:hypothetical protein